MDKSVLSFEKFKLQLEDAIGQVEKFSPADKVKAALLWNILSSQLQSIINKSVEEISDDAESILSRPQNTFQFCPAVVLEEKISPMDITNKSRNVLVEDMIPRIKASETIDEVSEEFDFQSIEIDAPNSSMSTTEDEIENEKTDDEHSSEHNSGGELTQEDIIPSFRNKLLNNVKETMEYSNSDENISDSTDALLSVYNESDNDISSTEASNGNKADNKKQEEWTCEICKNLFVEEDVFRSHISTAHLKPFKCTECIASFSTRGNLNVHKRKHTGERPFSCPKCAVRFTTGGNLRRHMLSHQGLKPYRCSICDARFTEKKSLLVHQRGHTGEKPFQCKLCTKQFSQRSVLHSHLSTHDDARPHLCPQCGKSFKQKSQLRMHEKRHIGVKNHSCQYCDSTFITKGDLDRHRKSHTGEKSFVCEHCGKSFMRKQTLRDHLNRHLNVS